MSELDAALEAGRSMIGKQVGESGVRVIERGAIRQFAEAIDDPNPIFSDQEYAKTTRFGDVIAPFNYLTHLFHGPIDVTKDQRPKPPFELPAAKALNGGIEWEFKEHVRPGDAITMVSRVSDVQDRQGRSGRMLLVILETTYTNQHDRVVAISRFTRIYR